MDGRTHTRSHGRTHAHPYTHARTDGRVHARTHTCIRGDWRGHALHLPAESDAPVLLTVISDAYYQTHWTQPKFHESFLIFGDASILSWQKQEAVKTLPLTGSMLKRIQQQVIVPWRHCYDEIAVSFGA